LLRPLTCKLPEFSEIVISPLLVFVPLNPVNELLAFVRVVPPTEEVFTVPPADSKPVCVIVPPEVNVKPPDPKLEAPKLMLLPDSVTKALVVPVLELIVRLGVVTSKIGLAKVPIVVPVIFNVPAVKVFVPLLTRDPALSVTMLVPKLVLPPMVIVPVVPVWPRVNPLNVLPNAAIFDVVIDNVPAPPFSPIEAFAVNGIRDTVPVPVIEPALPKVIESDWIVKLFALAARVLLSVIADPAKVVGAFKVMASP